MNEAFLEEIDDAFAKVAEELRAKYAAKLGEQSFSGQLTGVLLATAVKLAKDGGCPRKVLEQVVLDQIRRFYR